MNCYYRNFRSVLFREHLLVEKRFLQLTPMAYKPYLSIILSSLMLVPAPSFAQTPKMNVNRVGDWINNATDPYKWKEVAPIKLSNSNRLDSLMRGGNIYLSLQDAIALALENNLDIEVQRYGPQLAQSDYRRSLAGGGVRAFTGGVSNSSTAGSVGGAGIATNSLGAQQTTTTSGAQVVGLDPVFQSTLSWGHRTTPQTSLFATGTNSLISNSKVANVSMSKNWLTGTSATLSFNNNFLFQNAGRNDFNPSRSVTADLSVTQRLLQGFGLDLNHRNIHIARNSITVSELVFRQQVITTVSSVINIYWDLVSFNEDLRVKKQALTLNQKLYDDNKKQVEIGTLAPIEIIRAEAEVARSQQDLTISETNVLQQETVLKNSLSRTGISSPGLSEAHIIPTDRISMPDSEAIQPVQDMIQKAVQLRPELEQQRIAIENSKLGLKGTRNAMLPTLDAFFDLRNNSLAGDVNTIPIPPVPGAANQNFTLRPANSVDQFFLGGYATALKQVFSRNFPDYSAGVTLNIPIRNRQAKEDMQRDQLTLRQSEIRLQQQLNQVRVEVENALIGQQQARARFQTAVKNRVLQEQTLDAEQKKYSLGASTIFFVIQAQRDLTSAQAAEVTALSSYARAKVELERSTGQTLGSYDVQIDEAVKGVVSRAPATIK